MTTTAITPTRRRARGIYSKGAGLQQSPGKKGSRLPEYLEAREVQAVLTAAPHSRARLLFLLQWRAGLRVSEALDLEPADPWTPTCLPCGSVKVRDGAHASCRSTQSCKTPCPPSFSSPAWDGGR